MAGNSFTLYLTEYDEKIKSNIIDFLKSVSDSVGFDQELQVYRFAPKVSVPYCLYQEHELRRDPGSKSYLKHACEFILSIDKLETFTNIPEEEEILKQKMSKLPVCKIDCSAMCGGLVNKDRLSYLFRGLSKIGEAYFVLEEKYSDLIDVSDKSIIEVKYRDYKSYFGEQTQDENYMKLYEEYVPLTHYYLVPATIDNRIWSELIHL